MGNTPVVQTTNTPIEPIPPQSSNYLKFIIAGLIILLIGLFGGYYLIKSSSKPPIKGCTLEAKICPDGSSVSRTGPNCEFTPCLQVTNTPTPIPNLLFDASQSATVNWKTLRSIYGYSVKYPAEWFIPLATKDRLGSIDQIESYDSSQIKTPGKGGFEEGQVKLEFGKDSQVNNLLGVEERLSLNGAQYISKERTTLGNMPSIKIVQDGPGGKYTMYYVEKQYPDVYFIAIYGDIAGNSQKIINQILSTFRFD